MDRRNMAINDVFFDMNNFAKKKVINIVATEANAIGNLTAKEFNPNHLIKGTRK